MASNKYIFPEKFKWQGVNRKGDFHRSEVFWMSGLSGSGKSSISRETAKILHEQFSFSCVCLDGDNFRQGLCSDLGFSMDDRVENLRRVAEVSKLFCESGLIVLASFISPSDESRASAKKIVGEEHFNEVYVSTSLEECEKRDVKGLYKLAREGKVKDFTGVSAPFDVPHDPDLCLEAGEIDLHSCAKLYAEFVFKKCSFQEKYLKAV